jgi:hypothetical protein
MDILNYRRPVAFTLLPLAAALLATAPAQAKTVVESITSGKPLVNIRTRYESVDDDAFASEAEAMTVRTRLGYETAPVAGATFLFEFEDIQALGGMDRYAPPAPPAPPASGYAVVADPEQTEVNRIQLRYRGISRLDATLGRQRLMLDNQRFIGSVAFRQDEQTFDALSGIYTGIQDVSLTAAYVDKVYGITPVFDADVNDRLLNVAYNGFVYGKLIAYHYDLKNQEEVLTELNPGLQYLENSTSGVRFDGLYALPTTLPLRAIYRAEAAKQKTLRAGNAEFDTDYRLAEAGVAWALSGGSYVLTPLIGYEQLGADDSGRTAPNVDTGLYAFQTPYATKHIFNGWVDQYLVTPNQGLVDKYVSIGFDIPGQSVRTLVMYHDYASDVDSGPVGDTLDLGDEVNVQVMKNIGTTWIFGAKYGKYSEAAAADVAVSKKRDTEKLWFWAELNF